MYHVYAIYNSLNNKLYVGQTDNLEKRLEQHNTHFFKNSYTSRYDGEWRLIYSEELPDRVVALKREKQLKSYRGREFLKNLINPR